MPPKDAKPPCLGFLTVLEHPQHGLMGGYLVLNTAGRPLEFHCTAPVKPNRAQQILYGPTLEPFLYGEQIGQALTHKSQLEPLAICTDLRPALAVRRVVNVPVALVLPSEDGRAEETSNGQPSDAAQHMRLDGAHAAGPKLHCFDLGADRLAVSADREADREQLIIRLGALDSLIDLHEPFGRIREALEEAQRGGR